VSNDDWLDTCDYPVAKLPREVVESNPKYRALVQALAPLSPNQKSYVRALPAAHYIPAHALMNLQAAGMKISERTVYRWQSDPTVQQAVALYREVASNFAGIDALSVMLRVSAWADYCEELIPATDNNGNPVLMEGKPVLKKRDVVNGLKALELLGKHTNALGKDSAERDRGAVAPGPGLSITFIHNAGAPQTVRMGEVIDAEIINVPTPLGDSNEAR